MGFEPYLVLANGRDLLPLNGIATTGFGIEAGPKAAGLGYPAVSTQWIEGAGHGGTYRGRRVLPRDIDLPLQINAANREGLEHWLSRLAPFLAEPCELRWMLEDREYWSLQVAYTGGGDYAYGTETGTDWLTTAVSFRAGDPWWTYSRAEHTTIAPDASGGLLKNTSLARLRVSSPQLQGDIAVENRGDAETWPIWELHGPGELLTITLDGSRWFGWEGSLAAGETLTIDTAAHTVTDHTGANRYPELTYGPQFFALPAGRSHIHVSWGDSTFDSYVTCRWRRRRWTVI